jgi:sulfatase maturation enzyme AslB (radical SAM superfamily)
MKYLCTAPWTHTYVSPQGERRLCCASREEAKFTKQYLDSGGGSTDFKPISIEEHWNSDYMKDIRKRMLAGEAIPQCAVCNDNILNLHTYRKYFTETLFPHKIQDILDNTDETGHTTMVPVSYDYRLSNLCNFKCRMCGDQLSSSWETENKKHTSPTDAWLQPNTRRKIHNFQIEVLEEELQAAVDQGVIEEIYWVGGEPLMFEKHWTIMQQLVDSGQSKNVTVRYNTNLSRTKYKNYDLYSMLDNFKNVNICASIDATEDIGEYIRTGLKWPEFLQNFYDGMFLLDKYGHDAIVFDVTLTTPGLFGLKDMFDKVTELDVKSYFKFTYAFDPTKIIAPTALPKSITIPYCQELIEYMEPRKTWKTQIYIDSLKNLMERKSFDEEFLNYKEGLKRGKKQILFLEKIRDQKLTFRDILNEPAKEWWDDI